MQQTGNGVDSPLTGARPTTLCWPNFPRGREFGVEDARVGPLLRSIDFGGGPLAWLEHDTESNTWWTTIRLEADEWDADSFDQDFEVEFRLVEDLGGRIYLRTTWVVLATDELAKSALSDAELLRNLNDLNGEPGVTVRLDLDGGTTPSTTSLVAETESSIADLDQSSVKAAFERVRDFVAMHAGLLQQLASA